MCGCADRADLISHQPTLEMWWMHEHQEIHVRFPNREAFWHFLGSLMLVRATQIEHGCASPALRQVSVVLDAELLASLLRKTYDDRVST